MPDLTHGDTTPRNRTFKIDLAPAHFRIATEYYHPVLVGKGAARAIDGKCDNGVYFQPVADQTYLLQYDFYGKNCSLSCFIQDYQYDGTFELMPCNASYWGR